MALSPLSLAVFVVAAVTAGVVRAGGPEQVHLSLTETAGEMRVIWVVMETVARPSAVRSNCSAGGKEVVAAHRTYPDGGFNGTIYDAVLSGVAEGATCEYTAVTNGVASPTFRFTYRPSKDDIVFLSYGDMGIKNSMPSIDYMTEYTRGHRADLIVNVGDTSYADDYEANHNSYVFDRHFRDIEGYAAQVPFMTVPGNHESQYKFAGYLNRLSMPKAIAGPMRPFIYSFDYGPVHFLVYSSEHSFKPNTDQHNFIRDDLAKASSAEQRAKTPWIVMWSHRPLYCSDGVMWKTRCGPEALEYRQSIEALMVKAKVDLHISGHNHQFERSFPVSGCSLFYEANCSVTKSLHNAAAPVHIVNGAAGDTEGTDPTWVDQDKVPFRAFHDSGFRTGISRCTANRTALVWDFIYTGNRALPGLNITDRSDAGKIADSFVLTKSAL